MKMSAILLELVNVGRLVFVICYPRYHFQLDELQRLAEVLIYCRGIICSIMFSIYLNRSNISPSIMSLWSGFL